MKVLLVAINSKYTHTSLAVRTLWANGGECEFCEYTINEKTEKVVSGVFEKAPDIVCFSCYIWNIEYVLKAAGDIKSALPNIKIVLGGPEVTFSSKTVLENNAFVDAVIKGEGEEIFKKLCDNGFDFENTDAVTYRNNGSVTENDGFGYVKNLDSLNFAYTDDDLEKNSDKLIYYETSRGCPYNCSYCLSSTVHSVRFKSIDKVKRELDVIMKYKPKTLKFVDRTFNSGNERTYELIKYIIENGDGMSFHFEIAAHTLTDKLINLINSAPEGMLLLEVGLQSTNEQTINAIGRVTNYRRLLTNVKRITDVGCAHVHLDIIAGLPMEDFKSFKKTFNDAMSLNPDVLQLGFLKLLKGTRIRNEKEKYSYKFSAHPPYEVISSDCMSYGELLELKKIEEVLDIYHASGVFKRTLKFAEGFFPDCYSMFDKISKYFEKNGLFDISLSRRAQYEALAKCFGETGGELFFDILKLDWFTGNKNASTPDWSLDGYSAELHKMRVEIINENRDLFGSAPVGELLKRIHLEIFRHDVLSDNSRRKTIIAFDKNASVIGEIKLPQNMAKI